MDKAHKLELYNRSFVSAMRAIPEDYAEREDTRELERAIFFGIRLLGRLEEPTTADAIRNRFNLVEGVMGLLTFITPRKFASLFPITKEYKGKRWGSKDYFYTVEKMEAYGWDTPISEPFSFLWEFHNWDITFFVVNYMSLISDMRRSQGQPGIMEEWAAENNITLHTLHTAPNGKQFLTDSNGRSKPVSKPRPKHLKIVEGRKVKRRE